MNLKNTISKAVSYVKTTRFKTTLWYSSLFLLLEAMIGVAIYVYTHHSLNEQLDISLSRQAEAIYNFVSDSKVDLNDFQPDSLYASPEDLVYDLIFEAVTLNPRNTFVQVQFKDKIIFRTENLMGHRLDFPAVKTGKVDILTFNEAGLSPYTIRGAYLKKGKYKIIVAFPADLIHETLNSLKDIYVIIAPVFLIISILGGALISARSLSRIDQIIRRMDEITAQNLEETIEGEEYQDEYGRLVRKLNEMIHRIKTSIDYMNQFSISASHELKTPLTILRGEIEIALKSPKTPAEYREILQSNYEETMRLINIVDKLFFISRIDHSLIKIHKEKVYLRAYLEDILADMSFLGNESQIELRAAIQGDVAVMIDPEWMRQALFNLIDNAIKYGDIASPVIIEVSRLEGSKLEISVKNQGPGIPEEFISKIFDRFFRVESSRNRTTGGAGLGLSVVKSIVNWHSGEIKVTSEPGRETVFTIILQSA
ncbi:MAG: HAMP domain-containing protein [Ignavibacteria bacterium]|nr:HAMP domain-containing protein [Ignavibacteria bacterium]MCU7504027.1 HAMP domain-containing protein [Ignavibacteria bacterium]MCU7515399.1 HAMP domain-containing protein [Ignavibacteria bacterium]